MFSKKKDLDQHVLEIFRKTKSEKERNGKCLTIARHYAQLNDWPTCRRYVGAYIQDHPNSAPALRLLAECESNLGNKESALNNYRSSLTYDSNQKDVVFKVCELLCSVEVDSDMYQYWVGRAEALDSSHPSVFKLKEHILTLAAEKSSGIGVSLELENLIMAEQKARPSDPRPSIRLLQLYVDKKQETKAFSLAQHKESDAPHRNDITWYQALVKTVEDCQNRVENGWEFYSFKLLVLERLAFLSLDEEIAANQTSNKVFSKQGNLDILLDTVFKLDQSLFEAKKISQPSAPSRKAMAEHFLKHMSAQLAFYLACILFKKAKKDSTQWKICSKMSGPLLLMAHQAQLPEDNVAWLKDLPNTLANTCKLWIKDGHLRKSQAGNILLGLNSKKKFMDSISPMLVTKWQDELYKKIFPNSKEEKTSYLKTNLDSNKLYRTLPTPNDLWLSDQAAQLHLYQHLHLLVWYGLRSKAPGHPWAPLSQANDDPSQVALDMLPKRPLCQAFTPLKRFNKELPGISQATPESLSQMDLDAFIFGSVTCASCVLDEDQMRWSEDRPEVLPAALTDSLCTPAQKLWWKNICHVLRPETPNRSVSTDVRKLIRLGLEAIRSVDSQSGHQDVRLLSALARLFSAQAAKAQEDGEDEQLITSLYLRASHYWSCAKPALENIKTGRSVRLSSQDRFFHLSGKELDRSSAESLLYEACFSEGMQLVRNNRLQEAIVAFGDLSSPYASIQQALLYRRLGDAEKSDMSAKEMYLKRSLDNFYVTLDRLKGPKVDPRHSLNNSLRSHIEEVEELINGLFPNAHLEIPVQQNELNDVSDEEDYGSPSVNLRGVSSTPYTSSRDRPVTLANGTPLNGRRIMTNSIRSPAISTPRPREEARPSPERLEAQMRQLSVQRESELQAMARIVEASRSNDSSIRNELQYVKDSVRDITRDMQSHQREVMEQRREIQDLNKNVKEIQTDVQKILKLLKTTHISQGRSQVAVRETRNIPDEELYMYGDDDLENEMEQNQPQQNPAAAAAMMAAGNLPAAMYNAYPFRAPPPNYFPLARGVDAAALMYQNLAYLTPGALPFSEGQRLPEFQVATPQLMGGVVPMPTNPQMAAAGFNTLPPIIQDISPVQTPPQIQPEMPTAALNMTSISTIFEASPHAYQISMPPEAQIPTASPLDKAPTMPQISPQSMLQNVPSPTYSSVTPESQKKSARANRASVGSAVSEDDVLEHDAMSDFKPIIPLPDEIVQTTGEEDETVLFENRAKLFRFVEGEWKERGIGVLKVLESHASKKARILMRREQVLKVCCNHVVPSDIVLTHISGNDKTWSWAANDFADEKMRLEKLGVRFKTVEEADAFKDVIDRVKSTMPKSPSSKVPSTPPASVIVSSPATPALPATPATPAAPTRAPLLSTPKISFVPSTPNNNSAAAATVSIGGFTFTSAPSVTAKPQEVKVPETQKKEDTAKSSPFAAFTFGNMFAKSGTTITATTTSSTAALASTPIFQNSPVSQMSFSSIATSAPAASPFGTQTPSKGFGSPSLVFGSATTPKGSTATPADSTSTVSPGGAENENSDDFVPTADFKPVVPLPELIEVKTGEEGEEVLYEQRSKLLRFVSETREWKERGIGKMKMTWNPESCKVRLIMRREQVLKVCCNHFLARDMKLLPISSSDRSWTWVAQDYSEGTLSTETFALKFKLPEDAAAFRDRWLELQEAMDDSNHYSKDGKKPVVKAPAPTQQSLSGLFKPAKGNWECQMCYISNNSDTTTCAACSTPNPAVAAAIPPKAAVPALTADKDLMKQFKKPEGSWSCDLCYLQNKPDDGKCVACETPRPGASPEKVAATKNIAPGLTFGFQTPSKSAASQFSFGFNAAAASAAPAATTTASTWASSAPAFSFGTPAAPVTSSTSFAFGTTQPSFSFGLSGSKEAVTTTTPSFGFSMPAGTPASTISSVAFSSPQVDNEESDEEVENDEGEHIHFAPVIPLPDMVQVVTGEEEEEVLYSHRAKLFRWAGNEWKERGLGDIKILKHRENGNIRLLMRREQVLKLCLNHRLSSDNVFLPKGEANRSFQWYANDFSEGEMRQEHFAVLFKTEDIAKDFLEAALAAQDPLEHSIYAQAASLGQISSVSTVDTSTVLDTSVASSAQFQTPSKSLSFAQDSDPSAAVTPSFTFNSTAIDFSRKSLFGDSSATTSDDDVKILEVIEPKVSAEEIAKARELQLPDNFYAYKQRPACKGCPGCDKDEEFVEPKPIKEKSPPKNTTSIFGSTTFGKPIGTPSEKSTVNGSSTVASNVNFFMPGGNTTTFASLAQDNVTTGFGNLATGANAFAWGGAATPVFGAGSKPAPIFGSGQKPTALFKSPSDFAKKKDKETQGESSGEEEGEETHDPHFDPIIALPDIITVRTGEEDEDKVFCQRGKLYRYDGDTREWKERGVGEMKLLLHQATGRYRLLLRREQVHKVVLNQLLTKDLDMQPLKTSNNAVCWGALNYAEEEPRTEQLAVKFKNEDLLSEFKTKVAEAKERLAAQAPASMPILTGPSPPASTSPGKGPRTPPVNNEECEEEEEEEEEEEDDEDDYETYDEDYPESVVTETRGTVFARKDGDPIGPWLGLGVGLVKTLFYPDVGHYNVVVELDVSHGGETVRITVDSISHASSERTQDKEVCFSGMNEAQDANRVEYYKVLFENAEATEEFQNAFMEGLALAENMHESES